MFLGSSIKGPLLDLFLHSLKKHCYPSLTSLFLQGIVFSSPWIDIELEITDDQFETLIHQLEEAQIPLEVLNLSSRPSFY